MGLYAGRPQKIRVALLAEGVDRNTTSSLRSTNPLQSPSSRRAWIEIPRKISISTSTCVALLAEGVDRNTVVDNRCAAQKPSPSSRRAWIEIFYVL